MTYKELKKLCDEKINEFPEYKERYKYEIIAAKVFYKHEKNLVEEFEKNKEKIDNRYVLPFLLGYTNKVNLKKPMERVQMNEGASGGIDVDIDLSPSIKEELFEYLKEKYGEDKVFHVATYSRLGLKSALKDILRIYEVDYQSSNEFTKSLDSQMNLEENLEIIEQTDTKKYNFYKRYKDHIDLSKKMDGKIRQLSKHAGGVVILNKPISELMPVERVKGEVITSFEESGQASILDALGVIKIDLLSLSTLDVINNTIEKIKEKIYLIEDDDGIKKIVPQSYVDKILNDF
jgi:hypothetical protein